MHILLTNDDGINAEGIQSLRKILSSNALVTVVAPDREKSASGHGITVHKPLRVHKVSYENNCFGYAVNGTPADCVKLGVEELLEEKPDLIISGINSGPNLGTDVLYSGTVSAAIEGTIANIPSVAVSLVLDVNMNYNSASHFILSLAPYVLKHKLPHNTILNVNIPDIQNLDINSVKITKLGTRKYINCIDKRQDPRGKTYYWLGGEVQDLDDNAEDAHMTDIKAVYSSHISITPIHLNLTNFNFINKLKSWAEHWS